MRNETILDSMKRVAAVEPNLWSGIQKTINKFNEAQGIRQRPKIKF